ncbi:MAG: sugar-binding domain-containing protein [Micropruina sp.]|uniref:sugar-binding transcriptional regulator n=1 Tax=Micropruina sp. TaxID=2737536 RepID=UPI0039E6C571
MLTESDDQPQPEEPRRRSRTLDAREHIALLLEVARRYHSEGQSQAEIAKAISFSRATVSRMLSEARRRGIVQVRIGHPLERVLGIEQDLVKAFGLKQARVADPGETSASQDEVARCAADLMVEVASENLLITVSNGLAVTATVDAMPQLAWPRSRVVQMIGSVGSSQGLYDSPETCRRMARKLGGSFHPLPAPLVVSDVGVAQALRQDNQIATTLELGARADIALVGVGAVHEGHSGLIFRSYEDPALVEDVRQARAVGHVCGHHIAASGEHIRSDLCARTIAVEPERIREIPLVIGVAWGEAKVAALAAVMRGGFISALVTDRATALRLLELAGD